MKDLHVHFVMPELNSAQHKGFEFLHRLLDRAKSGDGEAVDALKVLAGEIECKVCPLALECDRWCQRDRRPSCIDFWAKALKGEIPNE
jgi:hypothetical protein